MKISDRLQQLIEQASTIEKTAKLKEQVIQGKDYVDVEQFTTWATSVLYVLNEAFGDTDPHYTSFKVIYDGKNPNQIDNFKKCKGILVSAKEDFDTTLDDVGPMIV